MPRAVSRWAMAMMTSTTSTTPKPGRSERVKNVKRFFRRATPNEGRRRRGEGEEEERRGTKSISSQRPPRKGRSPVAASAGERVVMRKNLLAWPRPRPRARHKQTKQLFNARRLLPPLLLLLLAILRFFFFFLGLSPSSPPLELSSSLSLIAVKR